MSSKKDYGEFTGFLYPPGGHLEPNESDEDGLVREFQEEFGVAIQPIKKIVEAQADIKNEITHWWNCQMKSYKFSIDENEVAKIDWFTKEEVLNHQKIWPATIKFFEEHISD